MFEGFETFAVTTQQSPEVTISGLKSGSATSTLPPLLLLHGFPQSHHIWHRVVPQLVQDYTVVVPDLRGYGGSSKPAEVSAYAKSAMARDFAEVMQQLGFNTFFVCGHDRGARVAHKLCVDYPSRVVKAIFLDIAPTLAMYTQTDMAFATAYFHWFLLIQPEPLPETLISGNSRKMMEIFMGGRQEKGLDIFGAECFEYYCSIMEDPTAVHAMCNDYRASATLDMDEARQDLADGRRIKCPLTVLWGARGVIEKTFDAVKEWKAVTDEGVFVGGKAVDSGHYIPEESPDVVVSTIRDFFT